MQQQNTLKRAVATIGSIIILASACLAGCAPQTSSESSSASSEAEAATTAAAMGDFAFSADADCAVCHTAEGDSLSDSACAASNHASLGCITCHNDVDGLESAHDGVAYGDKTAKRLKTTEVDEATCQTEACHGSYEALAEKTASSTMLTDSNGTVVNPHDMPENADHETVTCGSCHDMHASDDIAETAQKACISCHHMGIYECNTCHD